MSREIAEMVAQKIALGEQERALLLKNIKTLTREQRKSFFNSIKPKEKEIREFLESCSASSEAERDRMLNLTVDSLLEKKGDPDLVDSMVMDVVGRIKVYKELRERSEKEGIKLSAMTSFGGLSMVLFAVVIITAIVLYIINL